MVDESTKVDLSRQDRLRDQQEKPKAKVQESEFDQVLKKGQLAQSTSPLQSQNKGITEQAIRESAKRQDQEGEDRKRDEGDRKEKKDSGQGAQRRDGGTVEHKVVGKGQTAHGEGGGGGGDKGGGFDSGTGRRSLSKQLAKAGAKSLPVDLRAQFAARMASAAKSASSAHQANLTQQELNKIVQHVRIGINRLGQKEIQIDLHGEVFRGLKLRVTSEQGKVGVHFRTADARGRALFERNRDAIRSALAGKGIEVAEITVS